MSILDVVQCVSLHLFRVSNYLMNCSKMHSIILSIVNVFNEKNEAP